MSHLLWKAYWENDVDRFRRLLDPSGSGAQLGSKSPAVGNASSYLASSPAAGATSPRLPKSRKSSGYAQTPFRSKDAVNIFRKAEINSRDHAGLTILLRAAASTDQSAREFVQALLDQPSVDIYARDAESGWNALHRSLYAGNISIARMLLEKERRDLADHTTISSVGKVGMLIKTKDNEGHSPFDLYNATVALRALQITEVSSDADNVSDGGDSVEDLTLECVRSRFPIRLLLTIT